MSDEIKDRLAKMMAEHVSPIGTTRSEAVKECAEAIAPLVTELVEALKEASEIVRQDIKDIGPCEHNVGHCICGLLNSADRIDAAIAKAEGRP